ncbi:hypothetical protein [Larkinella rosea]|uniref:DUF5683 domain-containing protein n=1 Tax=Larkinella rosea TaxID=2025312 RepID=A0A3P1BIW4_9BACT|nr:hypothetical protein [Larkinella rosea]RRB01067.1 hypothetical protein EHT25_23110 [Larkinella rosea]
MRFIFLFLICLSILGTATAQRAADSTFYRPGVAVPAYLKPIERSYGAYYYGGKRLRSSNSLEIPFNELNDPIVNRHFRTYRTFVVIGQVAAAIPLVYVLTRNRGTYTRSGDYWAVYFGSIGVSLGLNIIGGSKVRKAVTEYNRALANARFGFSAQPLPGTTKTAFGFSLVQRL